MNEQGVDHCLAARVQALIGCFREPERRKMIQQLAQGVADLEAQLQRAEKVVAAAGKAADDGGKTHSMLRLINALAEYDKGEK